VPSTAGNFHDVHRVHPDGTSDRNLTADFTPGACCGQRSPQGDALLIIATSSDDDQYDLYIVTVDGDVHQGDAGAECLHRVPLGPDPS